MARTALISIAGKADNDQNNVNDELKHINDHRMARARAAMRAKARVTESETDMKTMRRQKALIIFSVPLNSAMRRVKAIPGMSETHTLQLERLNGDRARKECIDRSMNIFEFDLTHVARTHTNTHIAVKNRHM